MKTYSYLIKPASAVCNMACCYCFYADVSSHRAAVSHGIMSDEVRHQLILRALDCEPHARIHFLFQGGEPTLAGLSFYEAFTEEINTYKLPGQMVSYSIQTNGILIDESWCRFLQKHHFLVGVSLDGYARIHDQMRQIPDRQGTWKQVMNAIRLFNAYHIDYNIMTVLTASLAKHPQKLYDFYRQNNFSYVQLIPCLPPLDAEGENIPAQTTSGMAAAASAAFTPLATLSQENQYALTPERFASFYKHFYNLWLRDFQSGHYMSVTLFDNLIPMLRGTAPSQCGYLGFCAMQCVVESDGGVYPCDFYVLDNYYCGNIMTHTFKEIRTCAAAEMFLKTPRKQACTLCASCPFLQICHGQCRRMSAVFYTENYCGYQDFLFHSIPSMQKIAARLAH